MIPQVQCDVPDQLGGCLFPMGQAILDAVVAAIEPYDDPDTCGDCTGIEGLVSLGEPNIPIEQVRGAHVAVWLVGYQPTSTSQGGFDRATIPGAYPLTWQASWRIELREGCYPMPVGEEQIQFPSPELLHAVNSHVYAHGEAAYKALFSDWYAGTLFDYAVDCRPELRFGSLTPLAPQVWIGGWTWDVTGEPPRVAT